MRADWHYLWGHWQRALALGLGTGLAPRAPGTVGTLLGLPLYGVLHGLPGILPELGWGLAFGCGIEWCERAARELGQDDPKMVVWDEIVAYAGVLLLIPGGWIPGLAGFLLFRLFDIWKPFPIGWVDRKVHGGLGIMLDDVLAGLYAVLGVRLLVPVLGG